MKFKIPPQLKNVLNKLKPLAKHHYFIVLLLILGGLAYGVFVVNETLNQPEDDQYRSELMESTVGSKFNKSSQNTIGQIEDLQKSGDAPGSLPPLPSGRINPFAE